MEAQVKLMRSMMVAVLLVLCISCTRPSDEKQIRDALSAMQKDVESGKPADFMSFVADDFTGDAGTLDRKALHNFLRAQVLTNTHIGVTFSSIEVDLQGVRATVRVTVALSGGNGRWIPERGSLHQVVSGWRKLDGDWQCVNAQWERSL